MHRILFLAAAGLFSLGIAVAELTACGDMVMRPGHGARMRGYSPVHAASILLYVPAGTGRAAVEDGLKRLTTRTKHQAQAVQGVDALRRALTDSRYDIVIVASLNEAATVKEVAGSVPARPDVVPFAPQKTPESERQRLAREFGHVFVTGVSVEEVLEGLDHIMGARRRSSQPAPSR